MCPFQKRGRIRLSTPATQDRHKGKYSQSGNQLKMSSTTFVTDLSKKKESTTSRWINPTATAEASRQHYVVKRSPAAQIGSVGLDRYFDGIDPNHSVFSKSSTPNTSLSQSTLPKAAKALRFFKIF